MKNRKIQLKKLSLHKKTIASVNANAVQGGTGTLLETQLVVICTTTYTVVPNTLTDLSKVKTKCIECFQDKSKKEIVCNGGVTVSILC